MKILNKKYFITLVAFITILFLLEIGLRIGGSMYRRRFSSCVKIDAQSLDSPFTIFCLGDSYTVGGEGKAQDSYPSQLQKKFLENSKKNVSVVNAGICESNSTQVLEYLTRLLEIYKIDSVVLLVGSANRFNLVGYKENAMNNLFGFKKLRIYKLAHIFMINLKGRILQFKKSAYKSKRVRNSADIAIDFEGDFKKTDHTYFGKNDKIYKDMISQNSLEGYRLLSESYIQQKKYRLAEELLKEAIFADSKEDWAYIKLAECYGKQGKYKIAEELLNGVISKSPDKDWPYIELAYCYENQYKFKEAEELFKRALELSLDRERIYIGLGYCYQEQGKYKSAEQMYRKAIELNPEQEEVYGELSGLYNSQGRYADSLTELFKSIKYRPYCFVNYYFLVRTYELQSKYDADYIIKFLETIENENKKLKVNNEYQNYISFFKDRQLWEKKINIWLEQDLEKIVSLCERKNIQLIIQNYPYPYSAANKHLKNIANQNRLLFVDNYSVFSELVEKYGKEKYFWDYDHCSKEGHQIMAENIYNLIKADF